MSVNKKRKFQQEDILDLKKYKPDPAPYFSDGTYEETKDLESMEWSSQQQIDDDCYGKGFQVTQATDDSLSNLHLKNYMFNSYTDILFDYFYLYIKEKDLIERVRFDLRYLNVHLPQHEGRNKNISLQFKDNQQKYRMEYLGLWMETMNQPAYVWRTRKQDGPFHSFNIVQDRSKNSTLDVKLFWGTTCIGSVMTWLLDDGGYSTRWNYKYGGLSVGAFSDSRFYGVQQLFIPRHCSRDNTPVVDPLFEHLQTCPLDMIKLIFSYLQPTDMKPMIEALDGRSMQTIRELAKLYSIQVYSLPVLNNSLNSLIPTHSQQEPIQSIWILLPITLFASLQYETMHHVSLVMMNNTSIKVERERWVYINTSNIINDSDPYNDKYPVTSAPSDPFVLNPSIVRFLMFSVHDDLTSFYARGCCSQVKEIQIRSYDPDNGIFHGFNSGIIRGIQHRRLMKEDYFPFANAETGGDVYSNRFSDSEYIRDTPLIYIQLKKSNKPITRKKHKETSWTKKTK